MNQKAKQVWTAGNTVKVGFLSLLVVAKVATPGDGRPDAYVLSSKSAFYEFVPHNGLNRISEAQARELIAGQQILAARVAAGAIRKAQEAAKHAAAVGSLMVAA